MSQDDVEEYLERSKALIESDPQMGEADTTFKLIQPLIELLGWDKFSPEVKSEYPIQVGRSQKRADYALLVEGSPVVFIEVKGCDTSLSDGARGQLKSYIRQKGADWGLLTNGHRFEVFKRRKDSTVPDEVSLARFPIEELQENWHVLRLLSRELIQSDEADRIADRIEARTHATSKLQDGKEEAADEVAQLIVDRVGDTLAQEIEAASKEFIDDLIDVLGSDEDTPAPKRTPDLKPDPQTVISDEYAVTFFNHDASVRTLSGEKQADAMAAAVAELVDNHGLLSELGSLPYVPGKKKAILNTEPRHPSGEEMSLYRPVSEDYYVYVALNKGSKMRYISRFAEMCGLTAEFDRSW